MPAVEAAEFFARPSDSRCHHCGKVFTYRIDKYHHVVSVHKDKSGKKPEDDRPQWDRESGAQRDAWDAGKVYSASFDAPKKPAWEPTPAEAAQLSRNSSADKRLKPDASGNYDWLPRGRLDAELSGRSADHSKTIPGSADSSGDTVSQSSPERVGLDRLVHNRDNKDVKQGRFIVDRTEVSTPLTTSSSISTSHETYPRQDLSPPKLDMSTPEQVYVRSKRRERDTTDVSRSPESRQSFRCRVCSHPFTSQNSFFDHLQTSGHFEQPPKRAKYRCRVCRVGHASPVDLTRHIYKTGHHDPVSKYGRLKDEERQQRQQARMTSPIAELGASDPSLSPVSSTSDSQSEVEVEDAAGDEPEATNENVAEAENEAAPEEDLIDLNSAPPSEADDNHAGLGALEQHAFKAQNELDHCDKGESLSELSKSPGMGRTETSDAANATASPSSDHDCLDPHKKITDPQSQTGEVVEAPPEPAPLSPSDSTSKLSASAQKFWPQLKASAPAFTPHNQEVSMRPSSSPLNPSAVSVAPLQPAIAISPTYSAWGNSAPIPFATSSAASTFQPSGTSAPIHKNSCWALCGYYFPFSSGILHHLETGACAQLFNRVTSIGDLYKAAADTTCAHDFIDGRYLRDFSMKRDIIEKYRGNAYPFICPNEERCGCVFQQLHALFAHFERSQCTLQSPTISIVKRTVEEALTSLLYCGQTG